MMTLTRIGLRKSYEKIGYKDNEVQAVENRLVAYYVADKAIDVNELRKSLSKSLPDYMIPAYFCPA